MNQTVKRYDAESDPQDGPCSIWMEESAEGHYVTYSDYQKLATENAALKAANAEGQKWIGLSIETPATDAAIAEINKKWGAEILEKLKSDDRIDEQAWIAIWTLL